MDESVETKISLEKAFNLLVIKNIDSLKEIVLKLKGRVEKLEEKNSK